MAVYAAVRGIWYSAVFRLFQTRNTMKMVFSKENKT